MFRSYLLTAILIVLTSVVSFCQKATDHVPLKSSLSKLRTVPEDTNKVRLLLNIGNELISILPNSTDSMLAFYEKTGASGATLQGDTGIVQRIKDALPYFAQGTALSNKLQYDSGIIRGMIGTARVWVALSQLKQGAKLSDSVEFRQIKRHFELIMAYVKRKKDDQKTADFYFRLARLFPIIGSAHNNLIKVHHDSAAVYYHRAKNAMMESQALYWTGFYEYGQERAIALFRKSIEVAKAVGKEPPVDAYAKLGVLHSNKKDHKSALEYLHTAYRISAKDSTSSDAMAAADFGVTCLYLDMAYSDLDDDELSLKYSRTAMRVFERIPQTHPGELVSAVGNTVTQLLVLKRPREALDLLLRIQKDHPSLKSSHNHYVMLINFMNVYTRMKNIVLANKYCDSVIAVTDHYDESRRYGYYRIALFYINTKQYDKAKKYALLLKSVIESNDDRVFISQCYYMLHKIDSAQGNFKSALSYFTLHKQINDSSLNETSVREIERLNVEFDTKNKEQQLALISKDAELTHQQLSEAQIRTNITIAGLAVAIVVLILIFYLYRLKTKTGDALQQQRDEINRKNLALERAVQEKEWLLQEVHHRVKNNLHMISNLLSMQAYDLRDDRAKIAITDSHNRVQAMSIVHQKLSSDDRISRVHFSSYLSDLVDQLKSSYDTRRVHFHIAAEPLVLDAGKAISLGLIVNEAVTNSIKYAFPLNRAGTVSISLHAVEENLWKLAIRDDGVGIPVDKPFPPKSIGLTLIEGIARELDGEATVDSSDGFLVEVVFPLGR
jgi:two-component system, sensor histidine kinase PdtaS